MIIKANSPYVRYTGRWLTENERAEATANGSYFELAFCGETLLLSFDMESCAMPYPHVYVQVDGGAKVSACLEGYIRIAASEGEHTVKVILKGSVETQERWNAPRASHVVFAGAEAEAFLVLPEDNRPKIEFVGDSITEGIAIDMETFSYAVEESSMVDWDDSTAGYAWRTAEALSMRPYMMGYGCLGLLRMGAGNVPTVCDSYPYHSANNPLPPTDADIVVLNHGTNDRNNPDKAGFISRYKDFLAILRKRNPRAKILALTPFSGCLAKEIKEAVDAYRQESGDNVYYLDTTGLISPEPLHPDRCGHSVISRRLCRFIREEML
jgi:hypothetical protein